MNILDNLDWVAVRRQYDTRTKVKSTLLNLYQQNLVSGFVELALGVSNPDGNYSASEHALGPRILLNNMNAERRVFELAGRFIALPRAVQVPLLIRQAQLQYLWIGVGSELSCMVNPAVCWVANTRTIWTSLVIKHNDNIGRADQELQLYRDDEAESEMAYKIWTEIHAQLEVALTRIAEQGTESARKVGVTPREV